MQRMHPVSLCNLTDFTMRNCELLLVRGAQK